MIPLADNDAMKLYMQRISSYPLLTQDEEVELASRIAQGDDAAREKLINSNLRLVVKIAHDFKGAGLPLLDLIAEGNTGLMRAAEKFKPAKGAKFSSYSAWWIKQAMRRALANQARTIRIPVQSASKIFKIQTAKARLADELGREPTCHEIAEKLNLSERTVTNLIHENNSTFSLQDPIQHGEDGDFSDIVPDVTSNTPDVIIQDDDLLNHLFIFFDQLNEREQTILNLRFGLDGNQPKTLEEVSAAIGRTRERVRQIQTQALNKLRFQFEQNNEY